LINPRALGVASIFLNSNMEAFYIDNSEYILSPVSRLVMVSLRVSRLDPQKIKEAMGVLLA